MMEALTIRARTFMPRRLSVTIITISDKLIVDTLETRYRVNATLPKSIMGKYSQNFVNITLPGSTSASNPCKGYPACQVSVIILDTPITNFISNSKNSELKSMLVEVSISSTEVSSPESYIAI